MSSRVSIAMNAQCLLASLVVVFSLSAEGKSENEETPSAGKDPRPGIRESDSRLPVTIPIGDWQVDVMEMSGPPELEQLMTKFRAAITEHRDWMLEHIERYGGDGKPLPYDKRFGVSEREYMRMFVLLKKLELKKVAVATISIKSVGEQRYMVHGDKSLPELTSFTIDVEKNIVQTPFGTADIFSEIDTNHESAFGAWRGGRWKSETVGPDEMSAKRIELGLGIVKDSNRHLLYYDIKDVDSQRRTSFLRILMFNDR